MPAAGENKHYILLPPAATITWLVNPATIIAQIFCPVMFGRRATRKQSRSFFPSSPPSSRGNFSPSLLACLHDFIHVPGWPNLENVAIRQSRMLADELYSMIHVPRFKDKNAAELFFGFGIGA